MESQLSPYSTIQHPYPRMVSSSGHEQSIPLVTGGSGPVWAPQCIPNVGPQQPYAGQGHQISNPLPLDHFVTLRPPTSPNDKATPGPPDRNPGLSGGPQNVNHQDGPLGSMAGLQGHFLWDRIDHNGSRHVGRSEPSRGNNPREIYGIQHNNDRVPRQGTNLSDGDTSTHFSQSQASETMWHVTIDGTLAGFQPQPDFVDNSGGLAEQSGGWYESPVALAAQDLFNENHGIATPGAHPPIILNEPNAQARDFAPTPSNATLSSQPGEVRHFRNTLSQPTDITEYLSPGSWPYSQCSTVGVANGFNQKHAVENNGIEAIRRPSSKQKRRKRRARSQPIKLKKLTPIERKRKAYMRRVRACPECSEKKIRVRTTIIREQLSLTWGSVPTKNYQNTSLNTLQALYLCGHPVQTLRRARSADELLHLFPHVRSYKLNVDHHHSKGLHHHYPLNRSHHITLIVKAPCSLWALVVNSPAIKTSILVSSHSANLCAYVNSLQILTSHPKSPKIYQRLLPVITGILDSSEHSIVATSTN
ncbi:MAG: hypothetical protein Q9217_004960 [Psora testacea]